ncbi:MAG TPA: hypothetical protein DD377_00620 [Firmicutes bacterium]|nr:hypothetical protein [Bacillota bacterium]
MEIKSIQEKLASKNIDGYLLIDYESKNKVLVSLLGEKMLTRKIIAFIPKEGKGTLIVHFIDTVYLKDEKTLSQFNLLIYKTWQELLNLEKKLLLNKTKIMMDISNNGLLMRIANADYGSVEYIKSLGIEVISSGDLLQSLTAVLSDDQYKEELDACRKTLQIKDEAFKLIKLEIEEFKETNEYKIQSFIAKRFHEEGMVYDDLPLVANGKNASNPHYSPSKENYGLIKKGDLVLIDMWAKNDNKNGVYADITWMGYVGADVPKIYKDRFAIIKNARNEVISFLSKELEKRKVYAYEADDVARKIIEKSGYGEYFLHRVGHNIALDISPHGPGANLDNYETHDDRSLMEGTSFSDEPGIYAPDFGMRTETNLHIKNNKLIVVAGLQDEIIPILKIK